MPLPGFIKDFPEGDDDTYAWTTRLPKGGHQFLIDLKSEWQLRSNSEVLRAVVAFAFHWLPQVMESEGESCNFSRRTSARMRVQNARGMWEERRDVLAELAKLAGELAEVDHLPTRTEMEQAGEEMASAFGLQWPPDDVPLIMYDTEAKYVLDRVLHLVSKDNAERLNLSTLLSNTGMRRDKIIPTLEKLQEWGHLYVETEQRSGPPTTWIRIPVLDGAFDTCED